MTIQDLASLARKSISDFCMIECSAYCCRKGYLLLSEDELNLLTSNKRFDLEKNGFIKIQKEGLFSLNLGNNLGSCPQLKDSKCMIHTNSLRPSICVKFPIFIDEKTKTVHLSSRCLAVRENKLYPFVHKFIELGFRVD